MHTRRPGRVQNSLLPSDPISNLCDSAVRVPVPMSSQASYPGVPAPVRPAGRSQTLLLPAAPLLFSASATNQRKPLRLPLARAARHHSRLPPTEARRRGFSSSSRYGPPPLYWTGAGIPAVSSCFGKATAPKRCFVVSSRLGWVEEALMEIREPEEQSSVKVKKRPPLRRGKVSPQLPVPENIPRPSYVGANRPQELPAVRQIHTAEGIAGMRAACKLAARVLKFAGTLIKPSVTTNEIDREVHNMIVEAGAYPSPLGYGGFRKSIFTSVNECVCHGVPDSTQLQNGDIINIDVNVFLNGYHGGTSRTFVCGEADESIKHFLKAAEECLDKGISVCRDGVNYRKIGKKISKLAYFYGYHVVERFVGHGIGTMLHSEPLILHHANENSGRMIEGQTFTVEPILTMDSAECVTWEDGWTSVTADGSWAAQFKHTVLVTRTGVEILTKV